MMENDVTNDGKRKNSQNMMEKSLVISENEKSQKSLLITEDMGECTKSNHRWRDGGGGGGCLATDGKHRSPATGKG